MNRVESSSLASPQRYQTAVVLINYRVRDMCLRLLEQLQHESNVLCVVVVNNGKDEPIDREATTGFRVPVLPIFFRSNSGFARAANAGIRIGLSQGASAVLLLNPDLVIFPGAIDALRTKAFESPKPCIVVPGATSKRTGHKRRPSTRKNSVYLRSGSKSGMVRLSAAWAWMIPRETIDALGMLDPTFFFGREDTDYCVRLWSAGGVVIDEPRSRIEHMLEKGMPNEPLSLWIRSFHMMRGRMILLKKYPTRALGVRWVLYQLRGAAEDILAGLVKYRSLRYVEWQLRGLVPGARWPNPPPSVEEDGSFAWKEETSDEMPSKVSIES